MARYAVNLNNGTTDEQGIFRLLGKVFNQSGVIETDALKVSAQSSPDMSVRVSGSSTNDNVVFLPNTGACYHGWSTEAENVTISANASGVTKTDTVVAYLDTSAGSATANNPGALKFMSVRRSGTNTGAPTAAEVDAAVGNVPVVWLAHVTVANGASSINSGNIVDARQYARVSLADSAITTAKIANGAVTGDKIASEAWTAWTPTITASGSMTISAVVINRARYRRIGRTIFFHVSANFTTGGTASNTAHFSLPVTPDSANGVQILTGYSLDGSSTPAVAYISGSTNGSVEKSGSNFTLGTGRGIRAMGFYEATT